MAFSFLEYLLFVLEIFTFLWYANEESNDVMNCSTKTVKYSIKNISRNIRVVFFKRGTRNVHCKLNRMTPIVPLSWQHSWLKSHSVKNQISQFATLKSETEGPSRNIHDAHIFLILLSRLLGVDDPWSRKKTGNYSFN